MSSESTASARAGSIVFKGSAPTPEEAAAAVAAIERFVAETAPATAPASAVNPWQRAALFEGVMAKRSAFPAPPGTGFPLV